MDKEKRLGGNHFQNLSVCEPYVSTIEMRWISFELC